MKLVRSLLMVLCISSLTLIAAIDSPGSAVWRIGASSLQQALIIDSKLDLLGTDYAMNFNGTFTVLDITVTKACDVDSLIDSANNTTDLSDQLAKTITSKLDVIDGAIETMGSHVSEIRGKDFTGTWTLIQSVETSLCDKFSSLLGDYSTIDSKIDVLSAQELSNFVDTFTTIAEIADDVLDTMTEVAAIAQRTQSELDAIDTLLVIAKKETRTIDSKVDVIDRGQAESFVDIQASLIDVQTKLCTIESKVDAVGTIDVASTFTAIAADQRKACSLQSKADILTGDLATAESKVDVLDSEVEVSFAKACTTESKVDILAGQSTQINSNTDLLIAKTITVDSKIDLLNDIVTDEQNKISTIDSKLDPLTQQIATIDSKVDAVNFQSATIESKLDRIDFTFGSALDQLCNAESSLDVFDNQISTAQSNLDETSVLALTITSQLDVVAPSVNDAFMIACTLDSQIDIVDSKIDGVSERATTLASKIDVLDVIVQQAGSSIDGALVDVKTVDSLVDVAKSSIGMAFDSACTADSAIDVIDSKVDTAVTGLNNLDPKMSGLATDFDETWTILDAVMRKECSSESYLEVISSKIDTISVVAVDISGTFTALDAVRLKLCTVDSKVDILGLQVAAGLVQNQDFDGTYTMLDVILEKSLTVNSKIDVATISSKLDVVAAQFCNPITAADIGTSGYTISSSGKYFLAENVLFEPASSGQAISVNADNVYLDLRDRTIAQGNNQANVDGIAINTSQQAVTITSGSLRNFTRNGVRVGVTCQAIVLDNIKVSGAGADGLAALSGTDGLTLTYCRCTNAQDSGASIVGSNGLVIESCLFTDNGIGNAGNGLELTGGCDEVTVSWCVSMSNGGNGFQVGGTAPSDITFDGCSAFQNAGHGFYLENMIHSVIKNCTTKENTQDGIHLVDASLVEVIQNVVVNNLVDGIVLGTGSTGTSECYIGENSMVLTGSVNLREESGSGPNSVLGNFALQASSSDNYVSESGNTYMNFSVIDQSGSFPSPTPLKWHNISMTT